MQYSKEYHRAAACKMMYRVVLRTPDNSDGIYNGEHLVCSDVTLFRNGVYISHITALNSKELEELVTDIAGRSGEGRPSNAV